jgi:hypothetical protein
VAEKPEFSSAVAVSLLRHRRDLRYFAAEHLPKTGAICARVPALPEIGNGLSACNEP